MWTARVGLASSPEPFGALRRSPFGEKSLEPFLVNPGTAEMKLHDLVNILVNSPRCPVFALMLTDVLSYGVGHMVGTGPQKTSPMIGPVLYKMSICFHYEMG